MGQAYIGSQEDVEQDEQATLLNSSIEHSSKIGGCLGPGHLSSWYGMLMLILHAHIQIHTACITILLYTLSIPRLYLGFSRNPMASLNLIARNPFHNCDAIARSKDWPPTMPLIFDLAPNSQCSLMSWYYQQCISRRLQFGYNSAQDWSAARDLEGFVTTSNFPRT